MWFWEKCSGIVRVVREAHESRNMAHGHDFDHALAVANLAGKFCEASELVELGLLDSVTTQTA